jgi:hypothetical protein
MLPKRVLQIDNSELRLVETKGMSGKYIALSHCWGKELTFVTTRETLGKRMEDIQLEELPQTFRDAVEVTRALGLRYLWIDSLCIIQGDQLDWEEQSAVMADIYAMCYLNIAATRSSSGKEGFLGPRWTTRDTREEDMFERERPSPRIRTHQVRSFHVPTEGDSSDYGIRIRLSLNSSHDTVLKGRWIRDHAKTAPLLQRAWVHQEWTLSPRTVHFHANEMIWYCEEKQACECQTLDNNIVGGDQWSVSKDQIATLGELENKGELHNLWRNIVEDYVLLDLTYESDRLPAISGLACRFSQYLAKGDKYLAGLWKSDLARDLLWDCGSEGRGGPARQKVPDSVLAPSWSWASIQWGGEGSNMTWEKESKPKLLSRSPTVTYEQDVRTRIHSAECEPTGKNPFGSVARGTIHMEAVLCAVVTRPKNKVKESESGDAGAVSDGVLDGGAFSEPDPETKSTGTIKEVEQPPSDGPTAQITHSPSFTNLLCSTVANPYDTHYSLDLVYDTEAEHLRHMSAERTVYCLLIGVFHKNFDHVSKPQTSLRGLLLKPSTNVADAFERIGFFTQHIEAWVSGKEVFNKEATVAKIKLV